MTVRVEEFGDVRRVRMTSAGGRLVGIDVSAYVVRGVMIDTGFHRARDEVVLAAQSLGVTGIIVTHWHEDHAGNVAALERLRCAFDRIGALSEGRPNQPIIAFNVVCGAAQCR